MPTTQILLIKNFSKSFIKIILHNHLFNFETLPDPFPFFQPNINLLLLFFRFMPSKQGTPSFMCILNFCLVPNAPKFFKISQLFSINYSYFVLSNVTLFYVTALNFFPIYCYFMSTIPPQQTGAVKTLPLHTPH